MNHRDDTTGSSRFSRRGFLGKVGVGAVALGAPGALAAPGKAAPHRLHLDPDEIRASRHHHLQAVPDDQSDESDEWELEESEEEWDGPGDAMYRDYRRMQRSTFLVAHLHQREAIVREEMARWVRMMERLAVGVGAGVDPGGGGGGGGGGEEAFGLDCHDLSLENVFVDEHDHSKIVRTLFCFASRSTD